MGENKKNIMKNILIIELILLIIAITAVGINAWAKYSTAENGTITGQIARWSFKIVDGIPETSDVIDFAVTRTDNNTNVEEGTLAPGTLGEFEIGIDARGTETILEYNVEINLVNKPTNLKLYTDSEKTSEITVTDNKLVLNGFMSLEDVKEIKVQKIYWEWPYQIGETEEEQLENDLLDSEFLGKTMTMDIEVTGTEVLEEPIYLADLVQVGDYVNYNASSNGIRTFTSDSCLAGTSISNTISTDDDFDSNAKAQWRVLSVDKTKGLIELISVEPTSQTVTLSGGNGFVNAEKILNNIGKIYGQGKGAIGARSITIKDIEKYSSYDKTTYINKSSNTGYYGGTKAYTSGQLYREVKDSEGKVVGYEETLTKATGNEPITMTQTYYQYSMTSYISDSTVLYMLCRNSIETNKVKPNYWLASRGVELAASYCRYNVNCIMNNSLGEQVCYTRK